MKDAILNFLTLNYDPLKGKRTVIGLVSYLASEPGMMAAFLGSGYCSDHAFICGAIKVLATWFLMMGIRGK